MIYTLTCFIAALIAWNWVDDRERKKRAALATFILTAFCPFTVIYSAAILAETITIFLMSATILAATFAFKLRKQKRARIWWAVAGSLAGANVLFRPDAGLFAFGIGVSILISVFFGRGNFRTRLTDRLLKGIIFTIFFALPLTPWTIRNEYLFGVFQPMSPAHAEMPGEFVPHGYFLWLRTWIDDSRYIDPLLWGLEEKPLNIKDVPDYAFSSDDEKQRIAALFDQYNNSDPDHPASPMLTGNDSDDLDSGDDSDQTDDQTTDDADLNLKISPESDAVFAEIGNARVGRDPWKYYLRLPLKRSASMWFDTHSDFYPFAGELLPLHDLDNDKHQELWLPFFAGIDWLYTLIAIGGLVVLLLAGTPRSIIWLSVALLIIAPRILFFGTIENPEPRYLTELFVPAAILGGVFVPRPSLQVLLKWSAGILLFLGTASVVWWQNSRLTVLYDLCGVLEPATRIAQGDIPYRDFPFPYAPLTFVTQAAIIRLFGTAYWHHIIYACVVAGLSTLLTWRILATLFCERFPRPGVTAFLLSLPLILLGVYCIFPHPFYDPDSAFVILLIIVLLLCLERKGFPAVRTVLLGILMALPLFVKQNIGLAFLGSTVFSLLVLTGVGIRRKTPVRQYFCLLAGLSVGLGIALLIIQSTAGLDNYRFWTLTFATARRTPSLADMLSVYADWTLVAWVGVFLLGAFLMRQNARVKRWPAVVSTILMAAPFVWPVVYLMIDQDPSERAERLVNLWPLVFIASIILAYIFVRRLKGIASILPFILVCTAHGVFLSQQLWGSTYGIWPLLIILIGLVLILVFEPYERASGLDVTILAAVISSSLLIAGGFYVYSNERLDYVNYEDGEMHHSSLPQLEGLSIRGDWMPDFEELVKYTDETIPRDDGVIYLPGEDLFYYTTGRHPHFPVMLFDVTNNPYKADEIRERVMASDIEWMIVKNDTQIEADSMIDSKTEIFELLKPDFRNVESLNNYEIYKRRHANDPPDEDDDGDAGDDSSDSE